MGKEVRAEALELRLKGYSYNEIFNKLGVPKSTQSGWFYDLKLSKKAQDRIEKRKGIGTTFLIKRNKEQTIEAQRRAEYSQTKSSQKIGSLDSRDLLLVGTALYWGEGYKRLRVVDGKVRTHHPISLVNADPVIIKTFIKFMLEILDIKKQDIKASMRLYDGIDEGSAKKYWISETGLSNSNFRKTTWLVSVSSQRKRGYNRLPHGSLQIEVSDTVNFHNIMGFIKGIKSAIY